MPRSCSAISAPRFEKSARSSGVVVNCYSCTHKVSKGIQYVVLWSYTVSS